MGDIFRLNSSDALNDTLPTLHAVDVFLGNQVRHSAPGPNGKCGNKQWVVEWYIAACDLAGLDFTTGPTVKKRKRAGKGNIYTRQIYIKPPI